jgi:hypothetical protein
MEMRMDTCLVARWLVVAPFGQGSDASVTGLCGCLLSGVKQWSEAVRRQVYGADRVPRGIAHEHHTWTAAHTLARGTITCPECPGAVGALRTICLPYSDTTQPPCLVPRNLVVN